MEDRKRKQQEVSSEDRKRKQQEVWGGVKTKGGTGWSSKPD